MKDYILIFGMSVYFSVYLSLSKFLLSHSFTHATKWLHSLWCCEFCIQGKSQWHEDEAEGCVIYKVHSSQRPEMKPSITQSMFAKAFWGRQQKQSAFQGSLPKHQLRGLQRQPQPANWAEGRVTVSYREPEFMQGNYTKDFL